MTISPKRLQQDIELDIANLLREQEPQMERLMGTENYSRTMRIFWDKLSEAVQELRDEVETCIEESNETDR